jgi:hypothetical protein
VYLAGTRAPDLEVQQEMSKTPFTTAGRFALGASLLALAPLAAAAPAPSGPDVTSADIAAVSGAPGAPQAITLSGTSKLPNPALTYQVVIPPKHGTLAPGDPNNPAVFVYTPAPGYVGPDHFWYRAVGSGGEPDRVGHARPAGPGHPLRRLLRGRRDDPGHQAARALQRRPDRRRRVGRRDPGRPHGQLRGPGH